MKENTVVKYDFAIASKDIKKLGYDLGYGVTTGIFSAIFMASFISGVFRAVNNRIDRKDAERKKNEMQEPDINFDEETTEE